MLRCLITLTLASAFLAACAAPGTLLPENTLPPPSTEQLLPSATQIPAPTATVEPTMTPTQEPVKTSAFIAFTGFDQNIWLLNPATGDQQQVTQDGNTQQPGEQKDTLRYCCSMWSSDGMLLAFQRESGKPIASGYQYDLGVWVYDLRTSKISPVLDDPAFDNQFVAGYAWRPGTHLITYGKPPADEYFTHQTGPSPDYAIGIWAFDVDAGGAPFELVKPERGYSLVNPKWSENGRFMGFDEVLGMEGSGKFAYYDFETNQYTAWDKITGYYDWSPDGEKLAYTYMVYTPMGNERIWLGDRQSTGDRLFSPKLSAGYAHFPIFSPTGDQLAYLVGLDGAEGSQHALFVQPLQGGEPRQLGVFEQAGYLQWSPGGESIILSAGAYEGRQVLEIMLSDGSVKALLNGSEPSWQPVTP